MMGSLTRLYQENSVWILHNEHFGGQALKSEAAHHDIMLAHVPLDMVPLGALAPMLGKCMIEIL